MITFTERAAKKALRLATEENKPPVMRVGVRGGGCSGFNYFYELDSSGARDNDLVLEFYGLTVLLDPKSGVVLKGTEVDYETNLLKGGWKFNNPNAQKSCGCGESFSV